MIAFPPADRSAASGAPMTVDAPQPMSRPSPSPPAILSPSARRSIFLYLGILIVLLAFGGPSGGLIDIPISFLLKNKLHLQAHEVANFRLIAAIPLYLSFVFGFIRDIWNPLGMRDRGFMLLFGGISAIALFLLCLHADDLCEAARRGHCADDFVPVRRQRPERPDVDDRPAACDDRPDQRGVECLSVDPDRRGLAARRHAQRHARRKEPGSGGPHPVSRCRRGHDRDCAVCAVEAQKRVRPCPHRSRNRRTSDRGPPTAGAALADLSGAADLAVVEFRAGLGHATAVPPAEHAACHRRPMGAVERDLRRLLHSDFHDLRISLQQISAEDIAVVGDGHRRSADDSAAVHSFGDRRVDRRRSRSA